MLDGAAAGLGPSCLTNRFRTRSCLCEWFLSGKATLFKVEETSKCRCEPSGSNLPAREGIAHPAPLPQTSEVLETSEVLRPMGTLQLIDNA